MPRFLFRKRPSSVPPPARRSNDDDEDDDDGGGEDCDKDGDDPMVEFVSPSDQASARRAAASTMTTTTTMTNQDHDDTNNNNNNTFGRRHRRGRSHSRGRKEPEDDDERNKTKTTTKTTTKESTKNKKKQQVIQTQPILIEDLNEDMSLSAMAAVDQEELDQQQVLQWHEQQQQQQQQQQSTPHPHAYTNNNKSNNNQPVFIRYDEEEEQEEYHYMVKKTSRRHPNHHNNTSTTTTHHQQQQHNYHPSTSNNNATTSNTKNTTNIDVTLLQTQLRDAQRVVRAVLNLGDAPLDPSASLRAIRHFASLQKDYHKLQKEWQTSVVQKRELEQQWTQLVLEKNTSVLQLTQVQAQLEQQQRRYLKLQQSIHLQQQQAQSIQPPPPLPSSVDPTTLVVVANVSSLSMDLSPTKSTVELNTISDTDLSTPGSPAMVFIDHNSSATTSAGFGVGTPSNANDSHAGNSNSNSNAINSATNDLYQLALEHQLEECQALLRQRHDELQVLQEQLADARTQWLETSQHLTAQEEVMVLTRELELAKQEMDELEQERQMNMTEIVELSQQVMYYQQQQQQSNQQSQSPSSPAILTMISNDEQQVVEAVATTTASQAPQQQQEELVALQLRLTTVQEEHAQHLKDLQHTHSQLVTLQQQRIDELTIKLHQAQDQVQQQQEQYEQSVKSMTVQRQEMESRYTHQIGRLATRAADDHRKKQQRHDQAVLELNAQLQTVQDELTTQRHIMEQQTVDHATQLESIQTHWQNEWDGVHQQLREMVVAGVFVQHTTAATASDGDNDDETKQEDSLLLSSTSNHSTTSNNSNSNKPVLSSVHSLLAQLKWQREDVHRQLQHALQQVTDLQDQLQQSQQQQQEQQAAMLLLKEEETSSSSKQQQELPQQDNDGHVEQLQEQVQKLQHDLEQAQLDLERKTKQWQEQEEQYLQAQRLVQEQLRNSQQQVVELEGQIQQLHGIVAERDTTLSTVQDDLTRTRSTLTTLEQDLGQLQAEMDALTQHDVGQQLLHFVRSKRAKAAAENDSNKEERDKSLMIGLDDDPFGSDQIDEKVALQATLFRTQAQLRRQEDMYRLLADEADELRSTLSASQELVEDLEQQRNFNQVKVTELSRMIRLRGKLSDIEEQLMTKITQCASLTTQVDGLNFKLQESQRKMERLEQERQQHVEKLKELGQIWESHAFMEQAQKDMQAKVTEVIERWEASEARAEQMQMEREMSVERVTKLSFELAESRARVDELMEELDQERRASQSLHGGSSMHGGVSFSTSRRLASTTSSSSSSSNAAPSSFWTSSGDALDGSRHGTSLSNSFFGRLHLSKSSSTAVVRNSGTVGANNDDTTIVMKDADTAAGMHQGDGDTDDSINRNESNLTCEQAQVSTIRKLMKQIERLEEEKTRYADAVGALESGLQQVQRENVVKSAKIMQLEKKTTLSGGSDGETAATTTSGNHTGNSSSSRPQDVERERVVSRLKQTSNMFEGSMLALRAEMQELKANTRKKEQERRGLLHPLQHRPFSNTAPSQRCEPIQEKVNWTPTTLSSNNQTPGDGKEGSMKNADDNKERFDDDESITTTETNDVSSVRDLVTVSL